MLCSGTLLGRVSPSGRGWRRPRQATSPPFRCGVGIIRSPVMKAWPTRTSGSCWTTMACQSASSTLPGGGFRARPKSTFRQSTTTSRSSATPSPSCSPSPMRSGRARSTRSTSSGARGPSTRRRRPSPGCATAPRTTACSSTWSSCRGRGSPTWPQPGRLSMRPTGPTVVSCSTPGTTSGATPTESCCAPSRARPSSACSCATRRRHPRLIRSTPRCTIGCCRAKGSSRCTTLLADLGATGTAAPLGVEVFSDVLHAQAPGEVGRLAGNSLQT